MTAYAIATLRSAVRTVMDENVSDQLNLNVNTDTLSVSTLIEANIPIAVRIVDTLAPLHMVGTGESVSSPSISWKGDIDYLGNRPGEISLPTNFLRLVNFKMSDWAYGIGTPISETSTKYNAQWSKYGGVRGNPEKPVVAITAGNKLQFFSSHYSTTSSERATVEDYRIITVPAVTNNQIDIPPLLKDAAVYYTAYLVAKTLNQETLAAHLLETTKSLLDR